ncbi:MFS transporter [Vagococcus carniphilus]|uniref:Major facilitator superfamily (MFS) profile domain-containing protein n=1 Tax=Vagococcus carniphilus TaxID=218144 RepID=A0A430B8C0_9ENTE|nr:MFS transporter [Vagococcus carniphilus]QNN74134.1 MFS transporter [Vagococcus carniphilus]RSU16559.1 hypothetical protein CBF28_03260 [Vagococcus carniphilus]
MTIKKMETEVNSNYRYLLMLGHMFTDINQGALPAIIPFLILEQHLSYASAATLVLAANLVSSFIQPLVGYIGDKEARPWFMALGIFLAGLGIALLGYSPNYAMSCLFASISGVGVALFHPEGGKVANYVAGSNKGSGMSIFAVGGNLGFALGPIITSFALSIWGIKGTAVLIIPALIMSLVMFSFNGKLKALTPDKLEASISDAIAPKKEDDWKSFSKVTSLVFCRSILLYALVTFIPLFFIGKFAVTESVANINLTIYSLVGVAATLLGGRLADSLGLSKSIKLGFILLPPLIFLMLNMNQQFLTSALIVPISFAMNCSYGSLIALGQTFVPNRIGLASGISLGLSVSVGGLFAPVIGLIGDKYGLMIGMYVILAFSILAFFLTFLMPKEDGF